MAIEITNLGRRSTVLQTDVRNKLQVANTMSRAIDTFGEVDILVNNAGIGGAENWKATFDSN